MSEPQFFQTRMGQIFFEGTMPRILKALERIATALEALAAQQPTPKSEDR